MKKLTVCAALALLALGGPAVAEICTIDDVPAATLLVPYFEVDWTDPEGTTTLFSVNNASAAPAVAHVTFWTDLSVPTLDFDIYLTGYDVQTINVRDVFNGILPVTADDGVDPADSISNQGALSGDLPFPGASGPCSAVAYPNGVPSDILTHIRNAHTGGASAVFFGQCSGLPYGDGIARGYITIDNVTTCNLRFPNDPLYYTSGILDNTNQLWGDVFYAETGENRAQGDNLVHIEACAVSLNGEGPSVGDQADDCPFVPGEYTFYGRYNGACTAGCDDREPLATTFAARYLTAPQPFDDGTDLLVWRDSTDPAGTPFSCGARPGWFPLGQQDVVAFDEQENPQDLCFLTSDVSPPRDITETCFPAETGRYNVRSSAVPGAASLAPTALNGWLYLNLNHTFAGSPLPTGVAQAWVDVIHSADGRFSVGYEAIQLDSACDTIAGGDVLIP